MFRINKDQKTAEKIKARTFSELGIKERYDLQEWIVNNPEILGENLLIIQKEFSGFSDTQERLDLLAIDKDGNLVIIENKLDDSGREVVWQAMKYAAYCSTLTKEDIRRIYSEYIKVGQDLESSICEFLNKEDFDEIKLNSELSQRIILVAREFRKEVTSTVLWARKFGIEIQCIKVIPYTVGDSLLLDAEQIIPVKDVEEFTIRLDERVKDEIMIDKKNAQRHSIRIKFWHELLPKINARSGLFSSRNPDGNYTDHWLSAGAGISGVRYSFVITQNYVSVELGIDKSSAEENKQIFDRLFEKQAEIDEAFGSPLNWERLDDKKMSRIVFRLDDVNYYNENEWEQIQEFLIDRMIRLDNSLKKHLKR
jgi:hypothetical protein